MADERWLIAGLGNPGADYARHRHNAGFMAIDTIHESYKFGPWKARFQGAISEGTVAGRKVYLLKPGTYMNESGNAIGPANMGGLIVLGLPGGHDFDHPVRRAHAERGASDGNPSGCAVKMMHGNG